MVASVRRDHGAGRSSVRHLWLLGSSLLAAAGCANGRQGVIRTLPQPVAMTKITATPLPARRATRPRPSVTRQEARSPRTEPQAWRPRGGISDRWDTIVIHHSASDTGNAQLFDRYHRNVNRWDEMGYHFVIGNGRGSGDGVVEVGSRWFKQKHGAHCKTPDNHYNNHGIGICLVGDFRNVPPSDAQMASLTRLVRFLAGACGIPPQNIVTHRGVTGRTVCPGPKFPIYAIRRATGISTGASALP